MRPRHSCDIEENFIAVLRPWTGNFFCINSSIAVCTPGLLRWKHNSFAQYSVCSLFFAGLSGLVWKKRQAWRGNVWHLCSRQRLLADIFLLWSYQAVHFSSHFERQFKHMKISNMNFRFLHLNSFFFSPFRPPHQVEFMERSCRALDRDGEERKIMLFEAFSTILARINCEVNLRNS